MLNKITQQRYNELLANDLQELFETFVAQQHYIEVIACSAADIVMRHVELQIDSTSLYNMSYVFEKIDNKYALQHAIDDNIATETFYVLENLADAIAFVSQLYSNIEINV